MHVMSIMLGIIQIIEANYYSKLLIESVSTYVAVRACVRAYVRAQKTTWARTAQISRAQAANGCASPKFRARERRAAPLNDTRWRSLRTGTLV